MYVDDERRDPVYFASLGQILWSTLPPPLLARGCHALQCLVIEGQCHNFFLILKMVLGSYLTVYSTLYCEARILAC